MSEELKQAEVEFEKAREYLLLIEKSYLLKEEQLRKAQADYSIASKKYMEIKNKERDDANSN